MDDAIRLPDIGDRDFGLVALAIDDPPAARVVSD